MKIKFTFILTILFNTIILAQNNPIPEGLDPNKIIQTEKKKLKATLKNEKITIDGILNEVIWSKTQTATNFVSYDPDNGHAIPEGKKTEVKVLYDNDGIYIGALLYDDEPSKILKEIAQRDNGGTADKFEVWINGNNDGQQDFRFFVTASDGQADCVISGGDGQEDFSWDAVWESKAIITEFGWALEMKIPYSAIRFSNEEKQVWGINFTRNIRRDRQEYTWNYINNTAGTSLQQAGILEGIENIKTPTRLFLLPYSSFYVNANAQNKTKGTIKGGLDIKYGINDAFTLDAVLIPDFGQTKADQQVLNLGPFEQQFQENRPFFTEGTDLFSKGNLFYSRRIGGSPTGEVDLSNDEKITENPSTVGLLNALKVSGRAKSGLGIGVLNAVTENTYATITNTTNGLIRKELVEPISNYNILVFDKRFNQNSSVSFVNTNVTRNGNFRDANVSAFVFDLNTKENTFNLQGNAKISVVNENQKYQNGWNANIEASKTSGKYRYGLGGDVLTKNFNNNDLGINFETNYYSFYQNASYRILNPTKTFNSFSVYANVYHQFQIETGKPQSSNINLNLNASNKKNNNYGFNFYSNPVKTYDYFEARVDGRVFIDPARLGFGGYYSSNYNKKFAFDVNANFSWANQTARNGQNFSFGPRYRFNNKLSFQTRFSVNTGNNNKGYTAQIDTDLNSLTPKDVIIANRDLITYSSSVSGKYSINSKMNFNLSIVQYWSFSENKNFLLLEQDGNLSDYSGTVSNQNKDLSNYNFDLSYNWWFAPGSQISVLYRNNSSNFSRNIDKDFARNFSNLINNNVLNHTLSVSVRYFIDYNQAKNWL
jgi:Domain of unknown function (DUF5916)/Carbohydrate family 9 binding domain-like